MSTTTSSNSGHRSVLLSTVLWKVFLKGPLRPSNCPLHYGARLLIPSLARTYGILRPVELRESLLRGLENIASGLPPRAIKSFKLTMNSGVTSELRRVEVNLAGEAGCIQRQLCLAFR